MPPKWKPYGQCTLAVKKRRDRYNKKIADYTGVNVLAIPPSQHLSPWFPSSVENIIEKWLEVIFELVQLIKGNIARAQAWMIDAMHKRNATIIDYSHIKEARNFAIGYVAVNHFCEQPDVIDMVQSVRKILDQDEMDEDVDGEEDSGPELADSTTNDQTPSSSRTFQDLSPTPSPAPPSYTPYVSPLPPTHPLYVPPSHRATYLPLRPDQPINNFREPFNRHTEWEAEQSRQRLERMKDRNPSKAFQQWCENKKPK